MEINEGYIKAQRFFLCCAWVDGLLSLDENGKIIPNEDGHIQVTDKEWLMENSPTYFEYFPITGRVNYKTPDQALQSVWREVGLL